MKIAAFFCLFVFVEDHDSAPRDEQQTQQDAWHHLSQPRRTRVGGAKILPFLK